jgi:hypothetical protein
VKETTPPITMKTEKTIEGMVRRYNKMNYQYENGFFIVLSKHKLSVYKGNSKEGELLHSFSFPHGTDCIFLDEYKGLTLTDNNG